MVVLDSDVLINFLRNDKKAIQLISHFRSTKEELSITSINAFELLKGIPKDSSMDKSKVLKFLSNFSILSFDLIASSKAAEIYESLKLKGEIIDLADIMIASITLVNKETLCTENKSHFTRINGLKIR